MEHRVSRRGFVASQLMLVAMGQVVVPPEFQGHLRCPFAKVWLEHGAEKAAELLQVPQGHGDLSGRHLQATGGPPTCVIAPGPIGAAHQMGVAAGYGNDCAGTPAQRSPYMWPLRWTAKVEAKSLKAGSDEVQYESRGQVWYMLDKNWKRFDMHWQRGVQRALGQTPCNNKESGSAFGCVRDGDKNTTVIHRNDKMFFIDWAPGGATIANCTWTDLGVIGNVRPDWFMDDRGDATDVQYIGDSHVFYMGRPTLVKQWRKKDFASQYFTMSMQRLAGADGVHWPLILNIPGEGFGDDSLQHYSNHQLLNATDEAVFKLDEQYAAGGGKCVQLVTSGPSGPPTGMQAVVPSNLEVDRAAWQKVIWTGSPVWTPTATTVAPSTMINLGNLGQAQVCFDSAASAVRVTAILTVTKPVWAAVGFLQSEECLMTPRGGGDGEAVLARPDGAGVYALHYGPIPPTLKNFNANSEAALNQRLVDLTQATGFQGGRAVFSNGVLVVNFARSYPSKPAVLHMNYALGSAAALGYHASRGCFSAANLPACVAPTSAPRP